MDREYGQRRKCIILIPLLELKLEVLKNWICLKPIRPRGVIGLSFDVMDYPVTQRHSQSKIQSSVLNPNAIRTGLGLDQFLYCTLYVYRAV